MKRPIKYGDPIEVRVLHPSSGFTETSEVKSIETWQRAFYMCEHGDDAIVITGPDGSVEVILNSEWRRL
jgi:hypothetical protein